MHYCVEPRSFSRPQRPWGDLTVIITGYFDGETDGLLRCGICSQPYRFRLVDWAEGDERRVYALARLTTESYRSLMGTLVRSYGEPRSKYWWPQNPHLSESAKHTIKREIDRTVLDETGTEAVFLTEHIEQDILALVVLDSTPFRSDIDYRSLLTR